MNIAAILSALEAKAAKRVASIALDIQAEARQNATGRNGGPKVRTGTLRNSIVAQPVSPLEWQVGVVGTPNPESGVKASEYAPAIEFGTRKMPAKPFLRPAVDAVKAKRGKP